MFFSQAIERSKARQTSEIGNNYTTVVVLAFMIYDVRVGITCNCHSEFFWQGGGAGALLRK